MPKTGKACWQEVPFFDEICLFVCLFFWVFFGRERLHANSLKNQADVIEALNSTEAFTSTSKILRRLV